MFCPVLTPILEKKMLTKTFSNFRNITYLFTINNTRMWKVRFVIFFTYGCFQNGPCLLNIIFILFNKILTKYYIFGDF